MFNYSELIAEQTRYFSGRGWVFKAIEDWLLSKPASNIFLITGDPGTGKTAIAARLAQSILGDAPIDQITQLGGGKPGFVHFCQVLDEYSQTSRPNSLSPQRFIEALSRQLATFFNEYAVALSKVGNRNITINATQEVSSVAEGGEIKNVVIGNIEVGNLSPMVAFEDLIREPLWDVRSEHGEAYFDRGFVILVDALDETLAYDSQGDFLEIIGLAAHLPIPTRVILTSRSDQRVFNAIEQPIMLDLINDAPNTVEDVVDYAYHRLTNLADDVRKVIANKVAKASQGNFLYAYYTLIELTNRKGDLSDIESLSFPKGLNGIYLQFLRRELASNLDNWAERYRPILGLIVAARDPGLTEKQVIGASGLRPSTVSDALRSCTQFIKISSSNEIYIYNSSFRDFLVRNDTYRIYLAEASQNLAMFFINEYQSTWRSCQDTYALRYTPFHLIEAIKATEQRKERQKLTEQLKNLLIDFSFLEAKISNFDAGVDNVLVDLNSALGLGGWDREAQEDLSNLLNILKSERDSLINIRTGSYSSRLAAQINYCARQLGLIRWIEKSQNRLAELGQPYFELAWSSVTYDLKQISNPDFPTEGLVKTIYHGLPGQDQVYVQKSLSEPDHKLYSLEILTNTPSGSLNVKAALQPDDEAAQDQVQIMEVEGEAVTAFGELRWHNFFSSTIEGEPTPMGEIKSEAVSILPSGKFEWRSKFNPSAPNIASPGKIIPLQGIAVTPIGIWPISLTEARLLKRWSDWFGGAKLFNPVDIEELSGSLSLTGQIRTHSENIKLNLILTVERPRRHWSLTVNDRDPKLIPYDISQKILAVDGTYIGVDAPLYVHDTNAFAQEWSPFIAETLVAISGDDPVGVVTQPNGSIEIVDLDRGTRRGVLKGHSLPIIDMQFADDRSNLITSSLDGMIKVWNLTSMRCTWTIARPSCIPSAICLAREGKWLLSAWTDGEFVVWDISRRVQISSWSNEAGAGIIGKIVALPNREWAVTGASDGRVEIWDMMREERIRSLDQQASQITALILLPDAKQAITGSVDGIVTAFNLDTGEGKQIAKYNHAVIKISMTTDESAITASFADGNINIWNPQKWTDPVQPLDFGQQCIEIIGTPESHQFISTHWRSQDIIAWQMPTKPGQVEPDQAIQELNRELASLQVNRQVGRIAVAPDGKTILVGDTEGGYYYLKFVQFH